MSQGTRAEGLGNTSLSRVFGSGTNLVNKSVGQASYFEGREESQMIQLLAARIQLAKMRAEEGQALVEYALAPSRRVSGFATESHLRAKKGKSK